jgi:hypothetical protein
MSCDGGHLGFPIRKKNQKLGKGHYADRRSKMAATAGHRLTLDPMGKYSNAFYSETTNMIKAKLVSTVQVVSEKKHFETFFP